MNYNKLRKMVKTLATKADFDSTLSEAGAKLVLVDFTASWCGPCKQLAPIINLLEQAHKDSLRIIKVDADEEHGLAQMLGVRAVPTLILMDRTKRLDTHVGLSNYGELNKWVSYHLN